MKRIALALLVLALASGACAEERQAPPQAHFTMSLLLGGGALFYSDRAISLEAQGERSRARRYKYRAAVLTGAAGCFLVMGGLRLVLDDGIVLVKKEIRF